ncbi:Oxoglutarate/iron-dependent dioxygenase [Sesbania bispinosa]|nr:Oxoglutarate/iron-dependent dioxygenase [Sesbania bispinosa]
MVVASPNSIESEKILPIELPTVDLAAERSTVMKLIVKAGEEYGFFNVINHGVPHDIIANIEEAGFEFFAKPMAQKKQAAPAGSPFGYGCRNIGINGDIGEVEYLLLNASTSAPNSIANLSKTISKDPSNFSSSVSGYTDSVRELACEILELMAEGLGVPDTRVFSRFIREVDSDSVLRLNHYPPILNKDCKDKDKSPSYNQYTSVGFGAHSDPQIITILRSNDVCGLQISLQDGVWNPVTPDPSAFCVNVGDLLQVMTNGRFVSVRHRAVTNSYKSRMSVAYFGAPPLDACIVAPPVMVTAERPSLFKPFTWAEYKKVTYSLRLGDSRIDLFRNCTTQLE